MTKDLLLEVAYGMFRPTLQEHGFRFIKSKEAFVRRIPGGRQELGIPVWNYWPLNFDISLNICIRLDSAEEIIHLFSGSRRPSSSITTITHLRYFKPGPDKRTVARDEEVAAVLTELDDVLKTRIIPFFDAHLDVYALDRAVNRQEPSIDSTNPPWGPAHAVILAHLADNPDFEGIIAKHRAKMQLPESADNPFNRLVTYLRAVRARSDAQGPEGSH